MHTKALVSALSWAILSSSAFADDWPQWQGPDRNAISRERGLLKEWPKDGPPLAWKIKGLGGGYSGATLRALGGRYLQEEVSGQMMDQPFNGMGITGYDNLNKKYISFWIDNMGTGMSTMDGTMDQTGTVLTMYGKMDEPGTGEHGKNFKAVTRIVDKNKHVYEMYDLVLGEPPASKIMEIVYTRKK